MAGNLAEYEIFAEFLMLFWISRTTVLVGYNFSIACIELRESVRIKITCSGTFGL